MIFIIKKKLRHPPPFLTCLTYIKIRVVCVLILTYPTYIKMGVVCVLVDVVDEVDVVAAV